MLRNLYQKHRQFILFCLVGVSNTLITLLVTNGLEYLGVIYLVAWGIGYALGILNGYLWSSGIVFKRKRDAKNLTKFIVVNLVVWGISLLLMNLWIDRLHMNKYLAQVLTICITTVLNFFANRFWTFKSK